MPLTNTTIEDKSIKAEQLSFDIGILGPSTSGSIASGIGGVPGATGPQGPQGTQGTQGIQGVQGAVGPQGDVGPQGSTGAQGATGPQGPQGADGAGLTFPAGSQGRVVYVDGDLTATQQQGFEFNETTSKFTVDSRFSSSGSVAKFSNGAQGIKNADAAPVLEIEAADELGGSPANNHGFSVDYNGQRAFGAAATFARTITGFDGTSLDRSQFGVHVYDFSTTRTSTFFIHPRYDRRLVYHTGSTGLSTINTVELLTNNVTTAPTDSFGGKVTYAFPTTGSTTTTPAVSHEYLWSSVANGQAQYNLEVTDASLGSPNNFNTVESTARNTKITAWTSSTNSITNALNVENNTASGSGTAANSGTAITLSNRSSTTANRELGRIEGYWTTATDGSRAAAIRLVSTNIAGSNGIELQQATGGVRLSAFASGLTNTSLMLNPKGTGGIIFGIVPSGTNARGDYHIDMQFLRTTTTVPAGTYASLIGGGLNSISGAGSSYCSILGGQSNVISGTPSNATIIGGQTNTVSQDHAAILGGQNSQVLATRAAVIGGSHNSAEFPNSVAMGIRSKTYVTNSFAIASGETALGSYDSVGMQFVLRAAVGNNSYVNLLNDGNTLLQPDNTTWMMNILISGRTAAGASLGYRISCCHERGTGGTGQLIGTPIVEAFEETAQTDARVISVSGHPVVQGFGLTGVETRFVAHITVSQIKY